MNKSKFEGCSFSQVKRRSTSSNLLLVTVIKKCELASTKSIYRLKVEIKHKQVRRENFLDLFLFSKQDNSRFSFYSEFYLQRERVSY